MANEAKRTDDAVGDAFTLESPGEAYAKLPWYRRGSTASAILVVALLMLLIGPFVPGVPFVGVDVVVLALAILVSACVLSGPVYYPPKPDDKLLREWGVANKVVAVLFVFTGAAILLSVLLQ